MKQDMDELFNVVALGKRDIKVVRDAQSKRGAENWIRKHGYEDLLYVDDRDYDGDRIPDIVVRTRDGDNPYIVKGYTTEQSNYPYRFSYHTAYPTAEDRKGHPMRDFNEDNFVTSYSPDGQVRRLNADAVNWDKHIVASGYKGARPNKRLTPAQAFKWFIMRPVMQTIKALYKHWRTPLDIPAALPAKIEAMMRQNLITGPVMNKVYGEGIQQITDPHEYHKLTQRKQIRDACAEFTGLVIIHKREFMRDLLMGTVAAMQTAGVNIPPEPTWEQAGTQLVELLESHPWWSHGKLESPPE
jgi:hypothetical protein